VMWLISHNKPANRIAKYGSTRKALLTQRERATAVHV